MIRMEDVSYDNFTCPNACIRRTCTGTWYYKVNSVYAPTQTTGSTDTDRVVSQLLLYVTVIQYAEYEVRGTTTV
jgi:hypothetical protein